MGAETYLFDFDDTLVDSFQARVDALEQVFNLTNISSDPGQFMRGLEGRQLKIELEKLEQDLKQNLGLFHKYRSYYWNKKLGSIRLYPGVMELLRELESSQTRLGIVTQKVRKFEIDGNKAGALYELEELGIKDMFPVVVGFEDVTNYKPHPEGIMLALTYLQANPKSTLFIGDSSADMLAGQAAGCLTCHARWGIPNQYAPFNQVESHLIANSPQDLISLDLNTLNSEVTSNAQR